MKVSYPPTVAAPVVFASEIPDGTVFSGVLSLESAWSLSDRVRSLYLKTTDGHLVDLVANKILGAGKTAPVSICIRDYTPRDVEIVVKS